MICGGCPVSEEMVGNVEACCWVWVSAEVNAGMDLVSPLANHRKTAMERDRRITVTSQLGILGII